MVCTLDEEGEERTWEWPVDPRTRKVQYNNSVEDLRQYLLGNKIVFHHADFDIRALYHVGIHLYAPQFDGVRDLHGEPCIVEEIHDTQLLSHVVNSQGIGYTTSDFGRHALKPLAKHYLDIPIEDQSDLRKATIAARRIGKRLGWKLGKSLSGDSEVEADYWIPHAVYKLSQSYKSSHGGKDIGHLSKRNEWVEDKVPDSWKTLCETYCKGDVYRTLGLFFFLQEIMEQEGLQEHYEKELKLLPVTHLMEHFGMYADPKGTDKMYHELSADAESYKADAEKILQNITKRDKINVNSAQQLCPALQECGITLTKRTDPSQKFPDGQWATDASTLRELCRYTEDGDLQGNFRDERMREAGNALRLMVGFDPDDGDEDYEDNKIPGFKTFATGANFCLSYRVYRDLMNVVHPSYNQVGTAWTRYASREPNGQNVSKKAVLPLRRLFGPPPGYIWFAIDYSQLELRIYAYASADENLIKSFEDGYDFHSFSAMQMYGLTDPEAITSEQRRAAKAVNFGIIFGAGVGKIDQSSGQPGTYNTYMRKFPNAKKFMGRISTQVEKHGHVSTLCGRRLYVPQDKPYVGTNAVIQGTAGMIVKNAMVSIHEQQLVDWEPPTPLLPYGGSAIVGNNHDEILVQIPRSYPYEGIGRRIMSVMEKAGSDMGVQTPVDCKLILTNWGEGIAFK